MASCFVNQCGSIDKGCRLSVGSLLAVVLVKSLARTRREEIFIEATLEINGRHVLPHPAIFRGVTGPLTASPSSCHGCRGD